MSVSNIVPTFVEVGQTLGRMVFRGPATELAEAGGAHGVAAGDASPEATQARNRIGEILDGGLAADIQEPQVRTYENVQGMSARDLYDKTQAMDLATVVSAHDVWESIRNRLEADQQTFGPAVTRAIAEKWSGASASAAAQGLTDYANNTQNLVGSVQVVAEKVKLIRSALEIVKPAVPPPYEGNLITGALSWVPGPTWKQDQHMAEFAKDGAVRVLENVLYPSVRETDSGVPLVPQPHNPVHEPGGQPVVPGLGGQNSDGQQQARTTTDGDRPPATDGPADAGAGPDTQEPEGTEPPSTQSAGQQAPGATAPTGLTTQPSITTGGPAGTPTAPGAPAGSPGASGIPAPGGPLGPVTPQAPGGTVTGQPGAPAPGANAAARGAGAATGGRMGGMPAMGAPGARGGNNEEKESSSAIKDYLITRENGEELTGLDPEQRPRTVPPVLGEE